MNLPERERIIPVLVEDEVRDAYLDYAMSVIVSRALPDVRDGLKPVQRRILYAMLELGLLPNRPYKKSARIVGEVLGKYHPHGDAPVYEAMVRMAQPWSMRYPLVDGQGNFGSIDGDSPAAMRYTEARLAPLALEALRDIEKNTVDFRPNFDETLQEPVVLPTVAPLLLLNGASGIAVGMATSIPPHNLNEVVAALLALLENPELGDDELMQYIIAPDFPTGGIIYGYDGVREAYRTGKGRITVRGRATIETLRNGREAIVITELPFQVSKAALLERIAHLVRTKVIDGIADIRDESDREGMRIVIEVRRDAVPMVVLNNLYKHTPLQSTFSIIMLALVGGRPRVLTLRELLQHFLLHRHEVVQRRSRFELQGAERRAHIVEGLLAALDQLDAVIETIRSSPDPPTASQQLQERFGLTAEQARAILDMRLQRLTGLERSALQEEYRELLQTIERLRSILASEELQRQVIAEELRELVRRYGDERRTRIVYEAREFTAEDIIADEEVIVTITHQGFIKRTPADAYRRQAKGGRGLSGAAPQEDDFVEHVLYATAHADVLFFTNRGRCYRVKVYDLPEGGRTARGRSLANLIAKSADERVTAYVVVRRWDVADYIFMVTRRGVVKRIAVEELRHVRASGIFVLSLTPGDELVSAHLTDGSYHVVIATANGLACRFQEEEVRPMGRTAVGVRGVTLDPDDYVVGAAVVATTEQHLLIVGQQGYGKRTPVGDFRLTRRGAKGVICMNVTPKTGKVVAIRAVRDEDDIVVMTARGVLIRQPVRGIPVLGRNTQGVRLIRLEPGDTIADVAVVPHEEEVPTNGCLQIKQSDL
ncbi:MAG: DNA gyrase subunit A [Candidatus Kapabacteria bacterium]|nr:DNA gyrase subunit A [Candidatus Kapabacteria bacterium]